MAFTKITNAGFGLTTGTLVGVAASFSSTVSVGGTLTYEDVTNVDSVGLITARNGIEVTDKGVQVGTGATVDSAGDNILTFLTNGNERIRVTSDGKVGINTDMSGAPASLYPFSVYRSTGTGYVYTETAQSGASAGLRAKAGTADFTIFTTQGTGQLAVYDNTNSAERLRIDSSGRLLIATTSSAGDGNADDLEIGAPTDSAQRGITIASSVAGSLRFADDGNNTAGYLFYSHSDNSLRFGSNGAEAARLDSSGRLLVGATSARSNVLDGDGGNTLTPQFQFETANSDTAKALSVIFGRNNSNGAEIVLGKHRSASVGGTTIVSDGDQLGSLTFSGSDGTNFRPAATIEANVDATPGSSDMPGRLTFSTTADGASTPTERMRIDSSGRLLAGTTSAANLNNGGGASSREAKAYIFNTTTTTSERYNLGLIGGSANSTGCALLLNKTRATTNTHTVVQSGDELGEVRFQGSDGTYFVEAAKIRAKVDSTPGSQDMPGRLEFHTTADGASSATERLRIHSAGHGEFFSGAVTRVLVGDDVALSGSSQTVTGIPSWATKITIILYRASLSGTQDFLVQLRANGADISSNYNSASSNDTGTINDTSTDGFIITNSNASHKTSGRMVIERVGTDTKWVSSHTVFKDGGIPRHGAGDLSTYSGTIDGIKIKDTGNNTFDNGTITVIAEA